MSSKSPAHFVGNPCDENAVFVTEGAQNTKSAQLTQSKIACSSTLRLSANKPYSSTYGIKAQITKLINDE